jgi:hypothetical protein
MSTPLDRGSIVPPCVVCIEAGRATEATHQTKDFLCGCDQHIQELEQHGRAAIRQARRVMSSVAACGALAAAMLGAPPAQAEMVLNVPGANEPPVNIAPGFWPANAQPEYISYPASVWPLTGMNTDTVGQSVSIGQQILDAKIKCTTDPIVTGISEGAMVVDAEEIALENDSNAPLPSALTFIVDEDPNRGLSVFFRPGTYIPFLNFTIQPMPDSRYNTAVIVNQYDPLANPPDRPWNLLADLNAVFGLSQHTGDLGPPSAATQVTTVTDGRGGTITTYFIADQTLPLTQWLVSYKLLPQATVNHLNTVLRPLVDYGYSNVTPNDGPYLSEGQLVTPALPPKAAVRGAASANAGLPAKATATTTIAATGLTGGNGVVVGNGTKASRSRLRSTLAKIPTGLMNRTSNLVKHGK